MNVILGGEETDTKLFFALVGFFGTIYAQAKSVVIGSRFIPRNPLLPFVAATILSVFPGSFMNIWKREPKHQGTHNLLTSRGSFLAAKSRLIYDDVMHPVFIHNRDYLKYVPRDEYDDFVFSVDDEDIASGNFDKELWSYVLKENQDVPKLNTWKDYLIYCKDIFYIYIGSGHQLKRMKDKEYFYY